MRPTIAAFGQIEGQLAVGGIPLKRLAEQVGSTPFFAYDRALLTGRVKLLRSTLPQQIKLSYAIKANPMPAVVQHLATLVDAFDVASANEMRTALDTPHAPSQRELCRSGEDRGRASRRLSPRGSSLKSSWPPRLRASCKPGTGWGFAHGWQSG